MISTEVACAYNNFKIFCYSFPHLIHGENLYGPKSEHFDFYHYGPIFALLIAPFYYLPTSLSLVAWGTLNAWCFFKAIWSLPVDVRSKATIIWISANTLITSALNTQFNALSVAMIILSYTSITYKKEIWSTLSIVLGAFIKLYGIVGFAFFFFSKHKTKFIVWTGIWTVVAITFPMLVCKPDYLVQCYLNWYAGLMHKNLLNTAITQGRQDVCVMGMLRRITGQENLSNLCYIIPAAIIMGISYFRFGLHKQVNFQLALLASLLIFIVLASTGSEPTTYIIAFPGIGIWYILEHKKGFFVIFLLVLTLLVSSFSPTNLFPEYLRINYTRPYALIAFPVLLVWLRLNYMMITNQLKFIKDPRL